jgi:hypothetical protein
METTTQEIARVDWLAALEGLSQRLRGCATTIEIVGSDIGDQIEVEGAALQGLSFDPVGSEAGSILVELGDTPDDYMVHHVHRPRTVRVAELTQGETSIQIETESGETTLISLRPRTGLPPPPGRSRGRAWGRSGPWLLRSDGARGSTPATTLGAVVGAFILGVLVGGRCRR